MTPGCRLFVLQSTLSGRRYTEIDPEARLAHSGALRMLETCGGMVWVSLSREGEVDRLRSTLCGPVRQALVVLACMLDARSLHVLSGGGGRNTEGTTVAMYFGSAGC